MFVYGDFGPPSMAHELLGSEWYSFAAGGCYEVNDRFDVRVVVHAGMKRGELMARYPTGPEIGDYRLLDARTAKAFIARHLAAELRSSPEDRIPALEATLRRTAERLARAFPDRSPPGAAGSRHTSSTRW